MSLEATTPGDTETTRIPEGPKKSAAALVIPRTAAKDKQARVLSASNVDKEDLLLSYSLSEHKSSIERDKAELPPRQS